jgi:hypothetical protein
VRTDNNEIQRKYIMSQFSRNSPSVESRTDLSQKGKYFNMSIRMDNEQKEEFSRLQRTLEKQASPHKFKDRISLMTDMLKNYNQLRGSREFAIQTFQQAAKVMESETEETSHSLDAGHHRWQSLVSNSNSSKKSVAICPD